MKKRIAMLLALVMAASLCIVPASAARGRGPGYKHTPPRVSPTPIQDAAPARAPAAQPDYVTLTGIEIQQQSVPVPKAKPGETVTTSTPITVFGVYNDPSFNYKNKVDATLEILDTPPAGVKLEGNTLKITNEAEAGKVRILAHFQHLTDNKVITITKGDRIASAIVLTPPEDTTVEVVKADVPSYSPSKDYSHPFTEDVYDQYGKLLYAYPSVQYEIEGGTPTGVTLDTGKKRIIVDRSAQAGEVTIVGKLQSTVSGPPVVSNPVTYTVLRESSHVAYIYIEPYAICPDVPTVSSPGATSYEYVQCSARVTDQYWQPMTGKTVTWKVTDEVGDPVPGVSIDSNGKLTVTNEAAGAMPDNRTVLALKITATCGFKEESEKGFISREKIKHTFVEICDQAGDAPETSLRVPSGTSPNREESYEARVYDQYGRLTTGMVFWSLEDKYTGVELEEVSGHAALTVDHTAVPGTIVKLKAECSTQGSTATRTLAITLTDKDSATVAESPAAKTGLSYNGAPQALVAPGKASGGTMQYSLDGGTTWSEAVPTGKDVGAYKVHYKVVGDATHIDTAPATCDLVLIGPKFLGKNDLTYTGSITKVYDGTTDSGITVSVKKTSLCGSDTLAITGTAVYNSANVNEANTITFTPNAVTGNYELIAGELTIPDASITPRELIVTPNSGQSKKFGAEDPTLHSTTSGKVSGQIPDYTGALSRAEGEAVGQYDITLGTLALMDHYSSGFKASNYTLKMASPAVTFEITKADAPQLADIPLSQNYTVTAEQSADIGNAGMPEDAGTLTYVPGAERKTGSVKVDSWKVDTTGKVTYTLSGGAAGDTVTLPVTIQSPNYGDATVHVVITLTKPASTGIGITGPTASGSNVSVDKAKNGEVTVSSKSTSKGSTVTLAVNPDKGYVLDTLTVLDSKGNEIPLTEKNGKYTFTMPAGKVTVQASFAEEAPADFFLDVPATAYYSEAVRWAAEQGITGGVGNDLFAPEQPCTRAQIVTFLWRANGSPAPKTLSTFADVPADAYYAIAVAWAVENGITTGTSTAAFSPEATCTRAQAVTFLHRASGELASTGSSAFDDVAADAYYAAAVAWAEKNGITGGVGGGLFGSDFSCTRSQIVTLIYRNRK